jgi:hypothetical protein
MRYTIKRQCSWKNPLVFLDEAGQQAYSARGAGFTLRGSYIAVRNAADMPIIIVRKLYWRIRPGFEVYQGDDRLALIELEEGMRTWFRVEVLNGAGFVIRPSSWWTTFDFVGPEGRNAVLTMPLLKHPFPSSSELTIFDERQEIIVIAASIAVFKKAHEMPLRYVR